MSNPRQQTTNRMERSDSSSKTTAKIVKFSHSWTIENYGFFLHKELIESPPFGAESHPGTRWCLRLYPKGRSDESKDYISLRLVLLTTELSEVCAGAVVQLQGANGQSCENAFKEVRNFTRQNAWGWDKFIPRDTKDKKYLSGDKLTIRCEVSYAMETENIVNQDPQSQTQDDSAKFSVQMHTR